MSDTVDRKAVTKEKARDDDDAIVNRRSVTEEVVVDRTSSTQEDSTGTKLILHIHPTEKKVLLKGIPNVPQTCEVGESIVFGRGEDVDIFLNDDSISRRHMELTSVLHQLTQKAVFKVRVISTTLSININGEVITSGSECYLKTNDVIMVGQLKFTTEIIGDAGNAPYILEFKRNSQGVQQYRPAQDQAIMFHNRPYALQNQSQQPPQYYPPHPSQYQPPQPQYQPMQAPQYLAHAPLYQPQVVYQPPPNLPPYYPHTPDPNHVHMPGIQPAVYSGMPAAPTPPPIGMHSPPANSVHQYLMQHPLLIGTMERREELLESRGRSPSENEDSFNPRVPVEEMQPPKLSSLGETFQDTFPPKS